MSVKECRICYEDEKENNSPFIHPCACAGTRKFVHRECLEKWRTIKRRRIEFLQCQECKEFYNIGKKFALEDFKFKWGLPTRYIDLILTFLTTCSLFLVAPLLKKFDYSYDIPRAFSIANEDTFIFFLKNNEIEAYCYYYSFSVFVVTIIAYITIFYKIQCNIHNRIRYWNKAVLPYTGSLVFNFHFLYLSFFILDRNESVYILGTSMMSVFNYFFTLFFLYFHDVLITKLNTVNNTPQLKNYNRPRLLEVPQQNIVIIIEE